MRKSDKFILWFDEITNKDIAYVGGKNASLGAMYQDLTLLAVNHDKIRIPYGFAITAKAYQYFLEQTGIGKRLYDCLKQVNKNDKKKLVAVGKKARALFLQSAFPPVLAREIQKAYAKLNNFYKKDNLDVAVRSSATAEDLPTASFAGQQESFLNIKGKDNLILACQKCFASLFTDRAISYRLDKGFLHEKVFLSVGVQKMVRSDKACAGVMFTLDTESGFRDVVLINGAYGLGELVVKGKVQPDEFLVFKSTLTQTYSPIISRKKGSKTLQLIYGNSNKATVLKKVAKTKRNVYCLSDKEILHLAKVAVVIEKYYQRPMDIEWAKDGQDGRLYIVQARPETVKSQENNQVFYSYKLEQKGKILALGLSVGQKIGQGVAQVIFHVKDIEQFKSGQVLVTDMTDPDWEPVMKKASAIVTNKGGRTCHAAIVSRELGIPCITGTKTGSSQIKTGQEVTVSCVQGDIGYVYAGVLPYKTSKIVFKPHISLAKKLMLNIGEPDLAFKYSFIPNAGVGLARLEFIINNYIKIHPLALINFDQLKDKVLKKKIADLTFSYKDKKTFFVDKLAEGIGKIGAAFYPKEVIVRLSDFKTNEYANLIGGKNFEPQEANPMIGWRGASRYYDPLYKDAFLLEAAALLKVRNIFGLRNVQIMVPFCRTPEEGAKVLAVLNKQGLKSGTNNLKIYVMAEIPSNVILADRFADIFDGFSIGSNDLTQLVLGLDRDSEKLASLYDERNEAVMTLIKILIKLARARHKKIGICGQAPSDFPDFALALLKEKIDSISLTPDAAVSLLSWWQKNKK